MRSPWPVGCCDRQTIRQGLPALAGMRGTPAAGSPIASSIFRACKEYLSAIDSRNGVSSEPIQNPEQKSDTVTIHGESISSGEISFKVQVASSASRIETKPQNFKGITDITEISSGGTFKYATGLFSDFSSAASYRKKIEPYYPDAFVIAVKDNKILPLQQALEQKKTKKLIK